MSAQAFTWDPIDLGQQYTVIATPYGCPYDSLGDFAGYDCYPISGEYPEADLTPGAPEIDSINPGSGGVGTSGTITVEGDNLVDPFTNQVSASFSGSGVTVSPGNTQTENEVTLNYTIAQNASNGGRNLTLSNRFGASDPATFTVCCSTPVITGISPNVWDAGSTTTVTITGQGFGTSPQLAITCGGTNPCPAIGSYSITGASDTQIMVDVAVDPSAPNETVGVSVTSQGIGGSGFFGSGGGSGQSPTSGPQSASIVAAPSAPSFVVAYSSYIPVDHVTGYESCNYVVPTGSLLTYFIYKGDGGYGSYRTTETASFTPSTLNTSNFFPNTGLSKQYGFGSPANGSTLSYLDEDGVPNDCYLWNGTEQAPYSNFTYSTFNYAPNVGAITFTGSASNLFETTLAAISWDMTTFIDVSTPSRPTAYVTYGHTCYPAHQIKVGAGNTVVYSYTPPSNSLIYIGACLAFGVDLFTEVSGTTGPVPVTAQ
jgi:hypothetical protein